jgi:hypothetical protein
VSGPRGKVRVDDFGDLIRIKETRWLIKGRRFNVVLHLGRVSDTTPTDRIPGPGGPPFEPGRVSISMDLLADTKVAINAPTFTDEMENPVPAPEGYTATYSVDNPDIISLTDNGDGTGSAAATGELGSAILHIDVPPVGGLAAMSGDVLLTVVPGLAERVAINLGEVTEVTPD